MRIVMKTRIKDRVQIEHLSQSFNRMSATDKLMLVWQAQVNEEDSPLADTVEWISGSSGTVSRATARGDLRTALKTSLGQANFPKHGVRLWNKTTGEIRDDKVKRKA